MIFEKIGYSESVEAVNCSGNKKWVKSSVFITDINGEVTKATKLAKEYVRTIIKETFLEDTNYTIDPLSVHSHFFTTNKNGEEILITSEQINEATDNQIQNEFNDIKYKIENAKTKKEAEDILNSSTFKLNIELKKLVNQKQ